MAVFSVSTGGIPTFLTRAARAAAAPGLYKKQKVLVAIFQRGAMDGLMAVAPVNDPNYYKFRPHLALHATRNGGLIDLDNGFGIHPSFSSLVPYYKEGRFAIIHGIGSPNPTRSHFDAQDYMESGTPGVKSTSSGWLNRAVGLTGHEVTPFQAMSLTPELPKSFYGPHPVFAIDNLDDVELQGAPTQVIGRQTTTGFEALYQQTTDRLLNRAGKETFEVARIVKKLDVRDYQPANGAKYPMSSLGNSLKQIAILIKGNVGLEVAFTETGGWDTHVHQGTVRGQFASRASDLSQSIAAFWQDLGAYQDDVTLLTMTEFGRTVHENGSGGTDHGRASCMFVLGNDVDGGKVHGTIPELDPDNLVDKRDLPVTTDFRSLFSDVAGVQLHINQDEKLFPGWSGSRIPVMKT